MAAMATALVDIEIVVVRIQSAMRRSDLVTDVLEPSLESLMRMRSDIRLAKRSLNDVWSDGQSRKWKNRK